MGDESHEKGRKKMSNEHDRGGKMSMGGGWDCLAGRAQLKNLEASDQITP